MSEHERAERGTVAEVFAAFLRLGVTSFGGPIAHLGYFRAEFVERRRWLSDREYGDLVALCQFLPGPASSQVGFALGLRRAGALGAFAAFIAFTAPSAILMTLFAFGIPLFDSAWARGALAGLMAVAVAIVAQAVWGMARTLTPDARRAGIALVAAAFALLLPGPIGQLGAIAFGVVAGLVLCRRIDTSSGPATRWRVPRWMGLASAIAVVILVVGGAVVAGAGLGSVSLFGTFATAGSLVFGGGHVVLPLLHAGVVEPGWVSDGQFLAGYGAAQAMPGPLFTFSAYLGALSSMGPGGIAGAGIAIVAIFLPGFLILVAALSAWDRVHQNRAMHAVMSGANAAVVGILGAALYTPVFTSAVTDAPHFLLALAAFVALVVWKTPPWAVVVCGALGGALLAAVG